MYQTGMVGGIDHPLKENTHFFQKNQDKLKIKIKNQIMNQKKRSKNIVEGGGTSLQQNQGGHRSIEFYRSKKNKEVDLSVDWTRIGKNDSQKNLLKSDQMEERIQQKVMHEPQTLANQRSKLTDLKKKLINAPRYKALNSHDILSQHIYQ